MAKTPEERAAINRANAQKSTGPRTAAGKARSRMNARRHGLTGQFLVLEPDERKEYNRFARYQYESWEPVGPLEEDLVQQITDATWLLRRNESFEFNLPAVEGARAADSGYEGPLAAAVSTHHFLFGTDDGMKRFEAMGRHRARIEKSLSTYRNELWKAQTARRKADAANQDAEDHEEAQPIEPLIDPIPKSEVEIEEIKDILDAVQVAHQADPAVPRDYLIRSWHDHTWTARLTPEEKITCNRELDRRARIKLGEDPNTIPLSGWIAPGLQKRSQIEPNQSA